MRKTESFLNNETIGYAQVSIDGTEELQVLVDPYTMDPSTGEPHFTENAYALDTREREENLVFLGFNKIGNDYVLGNITYTPALMYYDKSKSIAGIYEIKRESKEPTDN